MEYHFEPGSDQDGVTFRLPVDFAPTISPTVFEWLVPGLLPEKLTFLLKALPKTLYGYMINNCAGLLATTSALQFIKKTDESLDMNRRMWQGIRNFDPELYLKLRRNPLGRVASPQGETGRRTLVGGYRFVRKMIRF